MRARTRAALGNHEYGTGKADAAIAYFRLPRRGYYSYELGAWHVVVLNSNCRPAGGCATGSPQQRWLAGDLAAHPSRCTLAYMHHPRFSSGLHGSDAKLAPLWRTLAAGGADVALAGHDHHYERFAPIDGIRSFVRRHRRPQPLPRAPEAPGERGRRGSDVRDPAADPPPGSIRLAVPPGRRLDVRRRRLGPLPLSYGR